MIKINIIFIFIGLSKAIYLRHGRKKPLNLDDHVPVFREPGYKLECFYCENKQSEEECNGMGNLITCADNALSCEVCFFVRIVPYNRNILDQNSSL